MAGGVGIGLALGWVIRQVRQRLDNPPVEITIALMTGYFTFIPANLVGASGVLAVVTAGVYVGWYTPRADHRARRGCRATRSGRSSPSC